MTCWCCLSFFKLCSWLIASSLCVYIYIYTFHLCFFEEFNTVTCWLPRTQILGWYLHETACRLIRQYDNGFHSDAKAWLLDASSCAQTGQRSFPTHYTLCVLPTPSDLLVTTNIHDPKQASSSSLVPSYPRKCHLSHHLFGGWEGVLDSSMCCPCSHSSTSPQNISGTMAKQGIILYIKGGCHHEGSSATQHINLTLPHHGSSDWPQQGGKRSIRLARGVPAQERTTTTTTA